MTNAPYPPPVPLPPQKSSRSVVWIILLVVAIPVVLAVICVVAALGIFGVRKYIANAKTAEARDTVEQIAKDAVAAYDRDGKLCPSASSPVPATVPRGAKYQSSPSDWMAGTSARAGFACLRFTMTFPQYYQYEYTSTPNSFTVIARGDLDGDGVESRFELDGLVQGGVVVVAPNIKETDPDE